ncbi:diguanylate cyclase [Armatimonas rosea]|uniref:Diguanylate cyclase (GGDEF)-like protein/putative nucleotidyltransferase with HDIG domain n=1 Tax=Armatimonas rosea TaxID=685828 RepID=A0A7W9SRR2_ARMRO|nr:diguanylate cyclase [Armatimonas rosea]MBB6051205.1 diguanylate cyclase (GGDEF)-like protein/putative nucleotidyltransferase with HDIG domain [Armatimonas rosea]
MKTLPLSAQIFLKLVYGIGGALVLLAVWQLAHYRSAEGRSWTHLVLFLMLAAIVGPKKIKLTGKNIGDDVGSMSLGFTVIYATMLHFGPAAAVFAACANVFVGCFSQPSYQRWFNVAISTIEATLAGLVVSLLRDLTVHDWFQGRVSPYLEVGHLPAVLIGALVYYAVNTGGVSTVIALATNQKLVTLWKENFLWTLPSYLAGASASGLALLLVHILDQRLHQQQQNVVLTVLLFLAPVGYLTYMIYETYMARTREKQQHIEELQTSQAQLADLYLATIKSLALAIDAKDQYTHQHIIRVQRYAVAVGERLGLSENEMEGLRTGALLHDIGKLGVPEYVLLKPGKLTPEEFDKIKKHPEIGAAILDPVEFPWPVLPGVKYHHEKWDGTGYPEGLKGEDIPYTARILAVADVYDALTSTRSYRNAWDHTRALETIRNDAGTHFDPKIAQAFLEVIDGVVQEMAREGHGPLVARKETPVYATKAEEAARDIQQASSELWALYEVAQTLSASMGISETLEILARKLEAILPGTSCLFLLKEDRGDTSAPVLVARAAVGTNREHFVSCQTLGPESLSQRVVEERKTFVGAYDADDLLIMSATQVPWVPLNAALIVPIVHQGEALGTINLYHQQVAAFSQHDQHLLEMIAERAAMAIYNGLLYDRTRNHAFTDPLTELYNLRFLTQYLDKRCVEGVGTTDRFAVLCLDLDNFKPVNDNFGHLRGDQVLRDLAQLLRDSVGVRDIVSRYGGDEFLVVLENAGADEAAKVADTIRRVISLYDPGLQHPRLGALHLGVSIGAACFPEDGTDCTSLLSHADQHMYEDKTDRKLRSMAGNEASVVEGHNPLVLVEARKAA